MTHFPASALVTLSWYHHTEVGLLERSDCGSGWRSFGASVVISGSQSRPTTSWAPATGRGCMACFEPDAARVLFGVDLLELQDQFLSADEVLGEPWRPHLRELMSSEDADLNVVLAKHLAPRWQSGQGRALAEPSLRQLGRHWAQRVACKAREWARVHNSRHVERRIKEFSGRSLRDLQTMVQAEGLFFAARDRYERGLQVEWAAFAHDEGFWDQAHMNGPVKQICGFTPTDFARRFVEDESFWMYRLWV